MADLHHREIPNVHLLELLPGNQVVFGKPDLPDDHSCWNLRNLFFLGQLLDQRQLVLLRDDLKCLSLVLQ